MGCIFGDRLICYRLFVAGEGNAGRGFEKLLPELDTPSQILRCIESFEGCEHTFEPSQTFLEFSAYCSTIGRILVVTIR